MISSFTFKNFKSFEDATFYIEEFNTLIGPNNAGKSNVFEGIQVLAGIISGKKVSDVLEKYIRNGSKLACRIGTDSFTLGCLVVYQEDITVDYEVTVSCADEPVIKSESLILNNQKRKRVIFKNGVVKSDNQVHEVSIASNVVMFQKQLNGHFIDFSYEAKTTTSQIHVVRNHFLYDSSKTKDLEYIDLMISNLSSITFIDPGINIIGNYYDIHDAAIKNECSKFVAILKQLCDDPIKKKVLFDYIQDIPENPILDFEFISNQDGSLNFMIKEKLGDQIILTKLSGLSSGIIRYITVIINALNCKENSLLMIEEFDQGIYPSRVFKLLETLQKIAKEKYMNIIVSTHNAPLLNEYGSEELAGTSIVYRSKENGNSKIQSLIKYDKYFRIVTNKLGLGSSVMDDLLLKYLKNEIEKKGKIDFTWIYDV